MNSHMDIELDRFANIFHNFCKMESISIERIDSGTNIFCFHENLKTSVVKLLSRLKFYEKYEEPGEFSKDSGPSIFISSTFFLYSIPGRKKVINFLNIKNFQDNSKYKKVKKHLYKGTDDDRYYSVFPERYVIMSFSNSGRVSPIFGKHLHVDDCSISSTILKNLKSWFQEKQTLMAKGAKLPKFPKIEISEDDPPAFAEDGGRLKLLYEEDRENGAGGLGERGGGVDVESLLAVYIWEKNKIIVWRKGLELCSRKLKQVPSQPEGSSFENLFFCVLVHELGHWFNAEARTDKRVRWQKSRLTLTIDARNIEQPNHPETTTPNAELPTSIDGNARSLSSRSYHEAWAQMFTWLYGQEVDDRVLAAFEALEKGQSKPYHAWRKLVNVDLNPGPGPYKLSDLRWNQADILKSLEWSRSPKMGKRKAAPATFAEPMLPDTNMIGYLVAAHGLKA